MAESEKLSASEPKLSETLEEIRTEFGKYINPAGSFLPESGEKTRARLVEALEAAEYGAKYAEAPDEYKRIVIACDALYNYSKKHLEAKVHGSKGAIEGAEKLKRVVDEAVKLKSHLDQIENVRSFSDAKAVDRVRVIKGILGGMGNLIQEVPLGPYKDVLGPFMEIYGKAFDTVAENAETIVKYHEGTMGRYEFVGEEIVEKEVAKPVVLDIPEPVDPLEQAKKEARFQLRQQMRGWQIEAVGSLSERKAKVVQLYHDAGVELESSEDIARARGRFDLADRLGSIRCDVFMRKDEVDLAYEKLIAQMDLAQGGEMFDEVNRRFDADGGDFDVWWNLALREERLGVRIHDMQSILEEKPKKPAGKESVAEAKARDGWNRRLQMIQAKAAARKKEFEAERSKVTAEREAAQEKFSASVIQAAAAAGLVYPEKSIPLFMPGEEEAVHKAQAELGLVPAAAAKGGTAGEAHAVKGSGGTAAAPVLAPGKASKVRPSGASKVRMIQRRAPTSSGQLEVEARANERIFAETFGRGGASLADRIEAAYSPQSFLFALRKAGEGKTGAGKSGTAKAKQKGTGKKTASAAKKGKAAKKGDGKKKAVKKPFLAAKALREIGKKKAAAKKKPAPKKKPLGPVDVPPEAKSGFVAAVNEINKVLGKKKVDAEKLVEKYEKGEIDNKKFQEEYKKLFTGAVMKKKTMVNAVAALLGEPKENAEKQLIALFIAYLGYELGKFGSDIAAGKEAKIEHELEVKKVKLGAGATVHKTEKGTDYSVKASAKGKVTPDLTLGGSGSLERKEGKSGYSVKGEAEYRLKKSLSIGVSGGVGRKPGERTEWNVGGKVTYRFKKKAGGKYDLEAVGDLPEGSQGEPLPPAVKDVMEKFFAGDLGHVQVHHDTAAQDAAEQLGAEAFTVGSHIYFGPGKYKPQDAEGQKLLAHELTHVMQAGKGGIAPAARPRMSGGVAGGSAVAAVAASGSRALEPTRVPIEKLEVDRFPCRLVPMGGQTVPPDLYELILGLRPQVLARAEQILSESYGPVILGGLDLDDVHCTVHLNHNMRDDVMVEVWAQRVAQSIAEAAPEKTIEPAREAQLEREAEEKAKAMPTLAPSTQPDEAARAESPAEKTAEAPKDEKPAPAKPPPPEKKELAKSVGELTGVKKVGRGEKPGLGIEKGTKAKTAAKRLKKPSHRSKLKRLIGKVKGASAKPAQKSAGEQVKTGAAAGPGGPVGAAMAGPGGPIGAAMAGPGGPVGKATAAQDGTQAAPGSKEESKAQEAAKQQQEIQSLEQAVKEGEKQEQKESVGGSEPSWAEEAEEGKTPADPEAKAASQVKEQREQKQAQKVKEKVGAKRAKKKEAKEKHSRQKAQQAEKARKAEQARTAQVEQAQKAQKAQAEQAEKAGIGGRAEGKTPDSAGFLETIGKMLAGGVGNVAGFAWETAKRVGGIGLRVLEGIKDATGGVLDKILGMGRKAGGKVQDAAEWALDTAGDVAGTVWDVASSVGGKALDIFGGVGRSVVGKARKAAGWALDTAGDVAGTAWDLATGVARTVGRGVRTVAGGVRSAAEWAFDTAGDVAGSVWDIATDVGGKVIDVAGGVGRTVGRGVRRVAGGVREAAEWAFDTAGDVAGKVRDAGEWALDKAGDAGEWILDKAGDVGDTVRDVAGGIADTLGDLLGTGADKVKDVGKKVGKTAKKTASKVKGTAKDAAEWVGEKASGVWDKISDWL